MIMTMSGRFSKTQMMRASAHTGERAAILKLHFHEFDEKELLRATRRVSVTSLNNFI